MIRAIPYTPLWFGVIVWVLITGAILAFTVRQLYEDFRFAYHSQSASAVVERGFLKVSQGRHGPVYTPCLDYRYQVGYTVVQSEATVCNDTYSRVSLGGSLPVFYITDAIADNRIDMPAENYEVEVLTYGTAALSLICLVGGAWSIRYYVRRNKINRDLLAKGLSCQGKVTERKYDLVGKYQKKAYYLIFTFRDNQGGEKMGKTWYLNSQQEELWSVSAPIRVYYDPTNSDLFTVDLEPFSSGR
jgi:hypothetical protein